jgi:hypothetical protein
VAAWLDNSQDSGEVEPLMQMIGHDDDILAITFTVFRHLDMHELLPCTPSTSKPASGCMETIMNKNTAQKFMLLFWPYILRKFCYEKVVILISELAQEPKCLATGASDGSISIFDIESGARKFSMSELYAPCFLLLQYVTSGWFVCSFLYQ